MTDSELLEEAAKACGLWDSTDPNMGLLKANGQLWNPLADDGDALRLAVKLGLIVNTRTRHARNGMFTYLAKSGELDEYAAIRQAIVRAAAAMKPAPESKT